MTGGPPEGAGAPASLRTGLVVYALFFVLLGSWALATPLFAPPDESSHSVRAASVVRGQIIGHKTTDAVTEVRAPDVYSEMTDRAACYQQKSKVSAECAGDATGSGRLVATTTYVGRYNPVYYAVIGVPSLVATGPAGIYLMRMVSVLVGTALLTAAVLAALRWPRPSLALLGVGFALTPMTVSLLAAVNPNGVETAAAICVWVAGLLALDPGHRSRRVITCAVIAACILACTRGLAPAWLAAMFLLAAVAVVRDPKRTLLSDRRIWCAFAVVGFTCFVAGIWTVLAGGLQVLPVGTKVQGSTLHVARTILGNTRGFAEEMIGVLQTLDTRLPVLSYAVWFIGLAVLTLLALAVGSFRARLALVGCIAITVLAPLLQLPSADRTGLIWQGRYALPIAVGIPILAVHTLSQARSEVVVLSRRLARLLSVLLGVAMVGAFLWAGRRNAVGVDGPILWFRREEWQPPVPAELLFVAFTLAVGGLVGLFFRLTHREESSEVGPVPDLVGASLP